VGQPVTPRVGGGDQNKTPRSQATSAPSEAPAPRPADPNKAPGGKSAPTDAPAVRSTQAPATNGDPYTPTVKMGMVVDPAQPPKGSTGN
jgi:hypothetical protein